jgi:hypothetical protein
MATVSLKWLSGHMLGRNPSSFAAALGAAAMLDAAGVAGMAYVAGFGRVRHVLAHLDWPWLAVLTGALVCSYVGYYVAYRGVYLIADGPRLARGELAAIAVAGFGGLLSHAGSALDHYALEAAGHDWRESRVRAMLLTGLEQGALAIIGTAAGITVLVQGLAKPTPDFSLPWAVIPVPGFALAFWVGERYRQRFATARGWRGALGIFLDAIHYSRELFLRPHHQGPAVFGMTAFWLADAYAMWAALAVSGFRMDAAALFVGYATGMVFSRRTVPVGGAGLLTVILPVTIWYSGAPFAAAVVAVFLYRIGTFWLPVPFALAALPTLHRLGTDVQARAAA